MPNQVRIGVGTQGASKAAGELDQLRDKFTALQKQGQKGFVIGAGAAITAGALGLLSTAIGEVGDVASKAIDAFREDQVSVANLKNALEDNIPAWDGNTDAIEKTLVARMKLGVSDDEQRAGLATLVGATHDATKALDLEAGALDIARRRNVSLETASDAVAKAYAGNTKGLKSLIPGLKLGSTSAETLANAFGMVQGAAEDYANTDAGKVLVSQVKVGEAMERLGAILSGPMADGTALAADTLETLIADLDKTGEAARNNEDPLQNIANLIHDAFKKPTEDPRTLLGAIGTGLDEVNNNAGDAAAAINDFWTFWDSHSNLAERRAKRMGNTFGDLKDDTAAAMEGMRGATQTATVEMSRAIDDTASDMESKRGLIGNALAGIGKSAKGAAYDFELAARRIQDASKKTADKLGEDAQDSIDNAFDPLITQQKLLAANAEVTAAKRAAAAKGASTAEQEALLEAEKSQAEFLIASAQAGQQNSKAYKDGVANLKTEIKNATGPTKVYLQDVLTRLQAIDSLDPNVTIRVNAAISKQAAAFGVTGGVIQDFSNSLRRRAKGGSVSAGMAYRVGEQGEETFVPKTDGTIIPHGATGTAVSGSFSLTVNVHAALGMTPAAALDIGNAVGPAVKDWMQRNGVLPRGAMPLHT